MKLRRQKKWDPILGFGGAILLVIFVLALIGGYKSKGEKKDDIKRRLGL